MLEEQKYRQAVLLGARLMVKHGLGDWKVGIHAKRAVLADCSNRLKTIRYSKHFLHITEQDQFERVTLHEIAHALVGPGHGHDNVFKRKCREITPGKAYDGKSAPESVHIYKYKIVCPECGIEGGTNRKRMFPPVCLACSKKGKKIEFIWFENNLNLKIW